MIPPKEWIKIVANKLDIEGLTARSSEGEHRFRLKAENRMMDVVIFPKYGMIKPKLRLYLSIYEVVALLKPEFASSKSKLEKYYVLVKDLDFPEIFIAERTEKGITSEYISKLRVAFRKRIIDDFFNRYTDGASVGIAFPGPYTYREVSNRFNGFSLFMGPYYEMYLICKCLARIPGFLEELNEYSDMYYSMPENHINYMGEGKFNGYSKPVETQVPLLIERLRKLYFNHASNN